MEENEKIISAQEEQPTKAKRPSIFNIVVMSISALYILVLFCVRLNTLIMPALVLSCIASIICAIQILTNKQFFYSLISYWILIGGTFLFSICFSAESFGKALGWNLLMSLAPILLSLALYFLKKKINLNKLFSTLIVVGMLGASLVYILFANLRIRPTGDDLWEGHNKYLEDLKQKEAQENSPNVLFILMDDMAYSDISAYSYLGCENATIKTPNIDSISDDGIYMENFYASAPVCTPSRFSALTGRYATRGYIDNVIFPTTNASTPYSTTHFFNPYQFSNNVDGILGDEITMAEALGTLGYDTYCIGKWNLGDYGEYIPTNQGFDYFYGSYYVNDMTPYTWNEDYTAKYRNSNGTSQIKEVKTHKENLDQSLSTGVFTDKVIETMDLTAKNGGKFFSYYATPWPHHPIYSNNNGNGLGDKTDDNYIDCIEEFDKGLGEIFDYMKTHDQNGNLIDYSVDASKSIYDNTVIVFTSDNGPGREGVTGSLRGRKNTTFDGGMKVPMLVKYLNGNTGKGSAIETSTYDIYDYDGNFVKTAHTKKIESSTMLIDLFPTIMNYVMGDDYMMPTDRIIDGKSLVDLCSGNIDPNTTIHETLFYMKKGSVQAVQERIDTNGDGIIDENDTDYKYYEKVRTENSAFIDQMYKNYLFDLDSDPAEGYNISMKETDIAKHMLQTLKDFRKSLTKNRRGIIK